MECKIDFDVGQILEFYSPVFIVNTFVVVKGWDIALLGQLLMLLGKCGGAPF